jgi:hypothetical protein
MVDFCCAKNFWCLHWIFFRDVKCESMRMSFPNSLKLFFFFFLPSSGAIVKVNFKMLFGSSYFMLSLHLLSMSGKSFWTLEDVGNLFFFYRNSAAVIFLTFLSPPFKAVTLFVAFPPSCSFFFCCWNPIIG